MKIFISHSSHDKWVARQISKLLEKENHTTFLDEKDIKTGDSIDSSIQEHLKESDDILLLLSPASIKSHWVFIELGGAKALGKRVIPILFHVLANEIPNAISQLLARDINELDKYIQELATPSVRSRAKAPIAKKAANKRAPKTMGGFSIGQKVKIIEIEQLTQQEREIAPGWLEDMDIYAGRETKIAGFDGSYLNLEIDAKDWAWSPRWLIKI
jgi:TIR domain